MQAQMVSFSVAAAAAAANQAPQGFNPAPFTGFLIIYGVTDAAISGLTALPSLAVILGGNSPQNPVLTGPIPIDVSATTARQGPAKRNILALPLAVTVGQQVQVNVSGGAGATATGRLWLVMLTRDEMTAFGTLLQ